MREPSPEGSDPLAGLTFSGALTLLAFGSVSLAGCGLEPFEGAGLAPLDVEGLEPFKDCSSVTCLASTAQEHRG